MQLVQLQQARADFESKGYGVAALSYDDRAILDEFAARKGISVPLLSDAHSRWLREAGLLNTEADGVLKGTSLPATLVIDPDRTVSHIFRESAYQDRITPATLLEILAAGATPEAAESPLPAKLEIVAGQTESKVTSGSLFAVTVRAALPNGWHVYAPGNENYIPLSLEFAPHPMLEVIGVDFPKSHTVRLLDEDVAVYEGRLEVLARVKVRADKATREKLPDLVKTPLKATLQYQCCTEATCFPPVSRELEWTLEHLPLDLDRSPETIQHKE